MTHVRKHLGQVRLGRLGMEGRHVDDFCMEQSIVAEPELVRGRAERSPLAHGLATVRASLRNSVGEYPLWASILALAAEHAMSNTPNLWVFKDAFECFSSPSMLTYSIGYKC